MTTITNCRRRRALGWTWRSKMEAMVDMKRSRLTLSALLLLAIVLTAASCGSAASSASSPTTTKKFSGQVASLIKQAAKEGELNVSWSSTFGGENGSDINQWAAAFNAFYGLNLHFSYTPATSMPALGSTLISQAKAGSPATTDVYIANTEVNLPLVAAKAYRPYNWVQLGKDIGISIPAAAVSAGDAFMAFSTDIYGIVYNTRTVPASQVPRSLAAVLQPQWKGKVASTPYAAGFYPIGVLGGHGWTEAKMTTYVQDLAHQVGGLIRCGDTSALLSGQFDMLVLDCDISDAILAQRSGEPISYVVPSDAPAIDDWTMLVPKTSRDPAAAALFAVFMMTAKGQQLSWNDDGNDLYLLPGSHDAKLLPKSPIGAAGIPAFEKDGAALSAYNAKFIQLLTAK